MFVRMLIVVGFLSILGCEHIGVEYTSLNLSPQLRQTVQPEDVEIFTAEAPVKDYVEIGTIKGMHDSVSTDEEMYAQMKVEAAKHGCNAIVVTQRGDVMAIGSCVVYR